MTANDNPAPTSIAEDLSHMLSLSIAENVALRAEIEDLRCSVIAFGAPAMVEYAKLSDLPKGHLWPSHYDILVRAGACMDDFVRHHTHYEEVLATSHDLNKGPAP